MQVSLDLLSRLETLAYVNIDENTREKMRLNLEEILSFANKISSLDTDLKEPFSIHSSPNRLREDEPLKNDVAQKLFSQNQSTQDGFFTVPKIIE